MPVLTAPSQGGPAPAPGTTFPESTPAPMAPYRDPLGASRPENRTCRADPGAGSCAYASTAPRANIRSGSDLDLQFAALGVGAGA